ncbi:MAG: sulfite exporter TauE/SafE family protein [Phycisphaeraceae bacterium]|nr:sulfite exporter TauE/SafE family protein [Phycisphaeraceae bacterium]
MIWAWIGAAAVGLSLGLLGSGGAILTVPILVYLVGHDEKSAIAESLAIVGAIAVVGMLRAAWQGRVDFRSAALLAFPGILGTYLGASAAKFIPGAVQLVLLAGLMLAASALMFRNGRAGGTGDSGGTTAPETQAKSRGGPLWSVALQGVGLGLATGLVGVGGGFLIVPVLVLVRRLPMPLAVGTSLAIIAVNSVTGLLKYLAVLAEHRGIDGPHVDWSVTGVFAAVGIAGSLVGSALAERLYPGVLKRIFAVFLIVMAGYIMVRQAPRVFPGVFGPRSTTSHLSQDHLEPR